MGEARGIPHSTTAAYAIIFATVVLATCGIRKPETACEWVAPRSSETLLDDIKRAEDIAIRHVDAKTLGAGTLRRRETHQQCEARLFGAIADSRNITIDAVREARLQLDRRGFDWLVNLPMALLTLAGALLMTRAVRRRFPDDRLPRIVAILVLSIGLGILVIGVGQVWAFAVEGARIGNDHLGHRGLRIPWGKHRATTFALVVAAVWVMAAMPAPRTRLARPRHPGTSP
jgi:hypothetical protein